MQPKNDVPTAGRQLGVASKSRPVAARLSRSTARSGTNTSRLAEGRPGQPDARLAPPCLTAVASKADAPNPVALAPQTAPAPDRPNAVAVAGGLDASAVLDTTAQLLPNPPLNPLPDAATTLRKRAKSKSRTEAVVDGLAALGKETPLRFGYSNTQRCAQVLSQADGKVRGKYCGNRWCGVCNRIRTAKLRTAYAPVLAGWTDAQFVTLTLPNVPAYALHGAVRTILKAVRRIANNVRRYDGLRWKAVRKLEVTYNTQRRDYHPHLHLLVEGRAQADTLVRRWLSTFPDAEHFAQKVVACHGPNAMAELFKYLTKQTVKDENGNLTAPPARALDTIYKAVRKLRTIQPMGFAVVADADVVVDADGTLTLDASTPAPLARPERTEWEWVSALTDWVDYQTGELLAGYDPSPDELRTLRRMRADAFPPDEPPPLSE